MRNTLQLSITLPRELARMVKEKVASGAYSSESEVIREGLRALQHQDAAIETWLRDEVVPAQQRVLRGEEKLVPAEEVFGRLEARYRERKAK